MPNASAARSARSSARDESVLAQLDDEPVVVIGARDRCHAGGVPGGSPEERRPADVDHLDRLVDSDEPGADRGGERGDVDDDDVDQADRVRLELAQLFGDVAPGEDSRIDRRVERLDLAADERRDARQLGDGADLDPVAGEMLAGTVGREDLHAEREQVTRQPEIPSRLATDSRARTRALTSHPHAATHSRRLRPSITGGVAYSDRIGGRLTIGGASSRLGETARRHPSGHAVRSIVRLPPWDYLFEPFNPHTFPGPLHADLGGVPRPAGRARRPVQHPDQARSTATLRTSTSTSGCCGRASALFGLLLDGGRLLVRPDPGPRDRRLGLGALVWVRFIRFPPILDAYEHKLAKQRYYTKTKFARPEATIRPKTARRAAPAALTAAMPIEVRRFGVGHRRPDGPPGTRG